VPVEIKLDPRESINSTLVHITIKRFIADRLSDMGILRVELIDGKELAAADRSGKTKIQRMRI
jgi:hypothetical protein